MKLPVSRFCNCIYDRLSGYTTDDSAPVTEIDSLFSGFEVETPEKPAFAVAKMVIYALSKINQAAVLGKDTVTIVAEEIIDAGLYKVQEMSTEELIARYGDPFYDSTHNPENLKEALKTAKKGLKWLSECRVSNIDVATPSYITARDCGYPEKIIKSYYVKNRALVVELDLREDLKRALFATSIELPGSWTRLNAHTLWGVIYIGRVCSAWGRRLCDGKTPQTLRIDTIADHAGINWKNCTMSKAQVLDIMRYAGKYYGITCDGLDRDAKPATFRAQAVMLRLDTKNYPRQVLAFRKRQDHIDLLKREHQYRELEMGTLRIAQ